MNIFSSQLTSSPNKHSINFMKSYSYSWKCFHLNRYSCQLTSSLNKHHINFMKVPSYSRNFHTWERALRYFCKSHGQGLDLEQLTLNYNLVAIWLPFFYLVKFQCTANRKSGKSFVTGMTRKWMELLDDAKKILHFFLFRWQRFTAKTSDKDDARKSLFLQRKALLHSKEKILRLWIDP